MYSLGIDIGSSSVKLSVLDIGSGKCVASATNPKTEAPIASPQKGWAEQNPDSWWNFICDGLKEISQNFPLDKISCIGITYQMHGLVAVDANNKPVRDSIIWCDSRAVETGNKAFREIGSEKCLGHLLNSPGNFTASKLAWVRENEPEAYRKTAKFMLPGDYIAYLLSGEISTTVTGLSEQILWDFKDSCRADFVADYYGIDTRLIPDTVPAIGLQCRTDRNLFGIPAGTPICYRAGDQPNNAFSLNVLNPGEIAATGGTSGVVYGVTNVPKYDPESRVNTFVHVNDSPQNHRYGILLCINGTGIMNSWLHRNLCAGMSYDDMNASAQTAPAGSDGLRILPFGNGAERMLGNRAPGARIAGLDLVRHGQSHVLRAAQEGIAFSFRYGIDIMKGMGLCPRVIRAGRANLFLSPLFRQTLATVCGATLQLYDTDGSLGAARGAALGAGFYKNSEEAFGSLACTGSTEPRQEWADALMEAYSDWQENLTTL